MVGREILWKIVSLDGLKLQLPAHILSQPPGDLHATDVFCNGVMGTRLGNQNSVPVSGAQ
jgi:hypothetical protein